MDDHFRELEQQGKRVEWHPRGYIVRDYERDWAWGYHDHRWQECRSGIGDAAMSPFVEDFIALQQQRPDGARGGRGGRGMKNADMFLELIVAAVVLLLVGIGTGLWWITLLALLLFLVSFYVR